MQLAMKCLRLMVGVTKWDRIRNEEICRWVGIEETLAEKVDRRVTIVRARGKDGRGVLAKKGQICCSARSTEERKT